MASVETFRSVADNKAGPVDPGDAMRFWLIVKGTLRRNHKKRILMNEVCMYAFNLLIISLTLIVTIIMFSGDGHVGKQRSVTETFPLLLAIETMHINIA